MNYFEATLVPVLEPAFDAVAAKILSQPGDPDWSKICAVMEQYNSWDFIGTPKSKWKYLIGDNGKIIIESTLITSNKIDYRKELYCIFDPDKAGYGYGGKTGKQQLLEGWLPVNITTIRLGNGRKIIQTSFAATDSENVTWIFIRITGSSAGYDIYLRVKEPTATSPDELLALPPACPEKLSDGTLFHKKLTELKEYWNKYLDNLSAVRLPEKRLENAFKGALVKAINSQINGALHYGVTRYFCDSGRGAESFPPTTTTMVNCCLYFGLFEQAKQFLKFHLDNFLSAEGQLLHRENGASLSEHGMFLDCISRYLNYTSDVDFLTEYKKQIKKIALFLIWKRHLSKHGMIKGCAEDDTRKWTENYWFSGNMWACRGLLELGQSLKRQQEHYWQQFGAYLVSEAETFNKDIQNLLSASVTEHSLPFVPPLPGKCEPFESMTANVKYPGSEQHKLLLSSYANYRFYPEMLSSGLLSVKHANYIIDFRRKRGGEFCGLPKFKFQDEQEILDDWPLFNQLYGLLHYDRPREFLLTLYGHMAHHQARNTFFAPEATFVKV